MLCASSLNPAELRKFSNFQLPNCNCKFPQYTLRRNFSLAIGLLQFLSIEFRIFNFPNLAISYIYPTYTQHIPNIYPTYIQHILNIYLTYIQHIPNIYLTYTLHIPCIYLPYTFPIPWHYFVFTKGIFCIKFVHYGFRTQNFQYSLIFHSCKNASQMQNEKNNPNSASRRIWVSMRIFL